MNEPRLLISSNSDIGEPSVNAAADKGIQLLCSSEEGNVGSSLPMSNPVVERVRVGAVADNKSVLVNFRNPNCILATQHCRKRTRNSCLCRSNW